MDEFNKGDEVEITSWILNGGVPIKGVVKRKENLHDFVVNTTSTSTKPAYMVEVPGRSHVYWLTSDMLKKA